tara:strand:+ start:1155 stop:1568 length:414 start_codon:yes stop_codon:yes gene_type:complete
MPFLTKQYKFCAAHRYWNDLWSESENYENFGEDIYIHGHNYTLDVTISGEINSDTGFIVDLQKLNNIVKENIISVMDHRQIEKDIDWFKNRQPSTENMVVFIWGILETNIPGEAKLYSVKLQETPTISTTYYGSVKK